MIDLSNTTSFKVHRHGWGYAMDSIKHLHCKSSPYLCDFIEKDFSWNQSPKVPKGRKWIGIFHNPPNMPKWFDFHNSPQMILQRHSFCDYSKNCIGIITLSEHLKNFISSNIDIPVFSIKHPTCTDSPKWNPVNFLKSKSIIQLGYWLRKIHSITTITKPYNLHWLPSDYGYAQIKRKDEATNNGLTGFESDKLFKKIKTYDFLLPEIFDKRLQESVILCDLYDSSANNAIIECISRNTPIIVNKLEAVVEYLGPDYPLYIDGPIDNCLEEDRIMAAHKYLKNMDKFFLSSEKFAEDFKKCLSILS